jgi:hypothetical protein
MSRGKSVRLMATLTGRYSRNFEKQVDKRSRVWRAFTAKAAKYLSDQGGPEGKSDMELDAIKSAAFDQVIKETGWVKFFTEGELDYGTHSQADFSWKGTVKMLGGPKRQARPVRTHAQVMGGEA